MAKPRELFNTPAPQAMSQMGAGIADAYANVGRIEGEGYAALGQGIAQGITAAAGAYAGYKQQQSQAKSYEGFLKNPLGQKMLGIDAKTADSYITAAKSMGGAAEQNQFYEMGIPSLMKSNLGLQEQLKLVGARAGAEAGLLPQKAYYEAQNEALKSLYPKQSTSSSSSTLPSFSIPETSDFSPKKLDISGSKGIRGQSWGG
jgi:hypothetical protein